MRRIDRTPATTHNCPTGTSSSALPTVYYSRALSSSSNNWDRLQSAHLYRQARELPRLWMQSLIFSETKQRRSKITRTEIRIKFLGPFVQAIRTLLLFFPRPRRGRQSKPVEASPVSSSPSFCEARRLNHGYFERKVQDVAMARVINIMPGTGPRKAATCLGCRDRPHVMTPVFSALTTIGASTRSSTSLNISELTPPYLC
ncbi:hypothetical protein BC826DRAFT_969709 [Russula brevipes]|nr:hypothetical protein BC826DRAFT_969709 [Russula brevipes]